MKSLIAFFQFAWVAMFSSIAIGAHPHAAPKVTSLTNPLVEYQVADVHHITLQRNGITAIVVDNTALDTSELPNHRAGYSGVASLTHPRRKENLFVPVVSGLNFEHIHDGTSANLKEKFEPRKYPMELRVINEHTVELYQPPTGNWKLESCGRYELLDDGVIQYSFECIPRENKYQHGYIGLFWASYIHQPEDKTIRFQGRAARSKEPGRWLVGRSPAHGVDSTHPPAGCSGTIAVDEDFPLTLVNHPSAYEYTQPWYYGVSHGMAYVQIFRPHDNIWLAQSPSGGGAGNPAWDFQWFISNVTVDQAYGFVMRAAYLPFENHEQIERDTRKHKEALTK